MNSLSMLPTPQQTRAVQTRAAILNATIDCLTRYGVAKTTTTAIARKAGVSQGALYKHFPTKPLLLAAAVEQLLLSMREAFVPTLCARAAATDVALADLCFELIWENYADPRLQGVFALYLAARTDPEIHDLLEPVVSSHSQALLEMARMLYTDAATHNPLFDETIQAILLTLHGAALMADLLPQDAPNMTKRILRQLAEHTLGVPNPEVLTWKTP